MIQFTFLWDSWHKKLFRPYRLCLDTSSVRELILLRPLVLRNFKFYMKKNLSPHNIHPLCLVLIFGVMELVHSLFYMTDSGEFEYLSPQECRTPCFPPNTNCKQGTGCTIITSLRVCRVLLSSVRLLINWEKMKETMGDITFKTS